MTGLALVFARKSDFPAFVARVREVYARTRSIPKAAEELAVGERTLQRWLQQHPELKAAQDGRPRDRMGRPKNVGSKE